MAELLLEVGCEELPASFVPRALAQLQREVEARLAEAAVPFGASTTLGTPRRLILAVADVEGRQPDQKKTQRGPALKAAYGPDGSPSKALEGFCRGQGVAVGDLRTEGDYVWVDKEVPGRPTAELLAEILPEAIRALTFPKTMRWGTRRMRFGRPIRWILAAFDGAGVGFEMEGIAAGLESRGHRFNHPEAFVARSLAELVAELRRREVEPDPEARRARILEQARAVASGQVDLEPGLVEENVFLSEWPSALEGSFRPEFGSLPEPVLVTVMAKHERFFPVRGPGGRLLHKFISIRNGGQEDVVREGNAWVLNARLNDARFFVEEDAKHTLDDFLQRTEAMTYQEKLGTVRQRADRLSRLAGALAEAAGLPPSEVAMARKAGLYAKADLSSGLVAELDELQGIAGGLYARRERMPDAVADAITAHYDLARCQSLSGASGRLALLLLVADQADKLAGYLGLGLEPSGSSDPYGLRRAAGLLIEAAWAWETRLALPEIAVREAEAGYSGLGLKPVGAAVGELMRGRYAAFLEGKHRYDVIDAVLAGDLLGRPPKDVPLQLEVVGRLAGNLSFVQTATRPLNILSAAEKKGIAFDVEQVDVRNLESEPGEVLWSAANHALGSSERGLASGHVDSLVRTLLKLEEPINAFFEATMVMADDEKVRLARLSLLAVVRTVLLRAGDFSRLVIEG